MKLNKKQNFWSRMIPIFVIVIVTIVLSLVVYEKMIKTVKESCWERLEIATRSTAQKIDVRLTDNISFLEAISDSFVLTEHLDNKEAISNYLNSIQENTIFENIDVMLPDGEIIRNTGEILRIEKELSFESLAEMGTHISQRMTSPFTEKEVICCFTPVTDVTTDEIYAVLCGTIDCNTIGEIFEVFTYGSDAQIFLIDRVDGNYIIDNWHSQLGNIDELGMRKNIETGKEIDLKDYVYNNREGRVAFVSKTNNKNTYQFHTCIDRYNWILCVVVQEKVVFKHVNSLDNILIIVGIVEFIIVVAILLLNMHINAVAVNSDEKLHQLEFNKAMNEAKSRFISNMSHDIRTPLNGIVGMLHIIKNHRNDQSMIDDCLKKIEISAQYLNTLANDMLDINEIESNKLILENIPVNLNQLADEIAVMTEPRAKEANISFKIDCYALKNPHVLGSPVHIKRVLVNLISNAIKYSKKTDAYINISFIESSDEKNNTIYKFIVSDNGIGMTEEFQKNMYDTFAQEKVTARSSYQGYGLGLAIVYRLVKKMNGYIELESQKNVGSTFTINIPLEKNKDFNPENTETKAITDLSGINILLVEDNEFNMEIAKVILTDNGATVTTAENGKIAVEIFSARDAETFDLILMDIMMPEMDGIQATKIIRSLNRYDASAVPIFAMTANTFTEEVNRCVQAGMNEHIAKPLDIANLLSKVAKYCKK